MTHVVAEPCVGCTFTECVEVCPDCFYVGPNFDRPRSSEMVEMWVRDAPLVSDD